MYDWEGENRIVWWSVQAIQDLDEKSQAILEYNSRFSKEAEEDTAWERYKAMQGQLA